MDRRFAFSVSAIASLASMAGRSGWGSGPTPFAGFLVLLLAFTPAFAEDEPLYRSSVVGTDFDFITETDPDTFDRLEDKSKGLAEMPDKSDRSAALRQEAFLFVAHFSDGTRVNLAIDADFETQDAARKEALRYTPRLGKLPTALRQGVSRLVVHKGGEDVTAFSDIGLMVLYSDNATKRIKTHDLEETIFHESVHAAWDKTHASSPEWIDAQKKDGGFVTEYAKKNPKTEDLSGVGALRLRLNPSPGPDSQGGGREDRSRYPQPDRLRREVLTERQADPFSPSKRISEQC